ncbi:MULTISPECIES: hypothetical protein [unclassified Mycolicibacterium]|uniref:hypothetical protein n=1 Tax=unclassified Mycolicibacterium TaxID=2636767 RepID=UPI0012DED32D|nr:MULTISPECIES: hypothetical protein [unclassified Mycolicibacterium]MUM05183.1 hypothetical protein [Mycolicibacterium sp. CBMA 213]
MQLTAATQLDNPFTVLFNPVFSQVVTSVSSIATGIASHPMPILNAIALNQIDNVKTLVNAANTTATQLGTAVHQLPGVLNYVGGYLRQGQLSNAYDTMLMWAIRPVLNIALSVLPQVLPMITNPIDRLSAAIKAAEETGMMSLMGIIPALAQAPPLFLRGVETAVAAVKAGNPIAAVNALMHGTADALKLSVQFAGYIATGLLVRTPQAIAKAIRPSLDFTSSSLLNVSRTEAPTAGTVLADGPAAANALPSGTVNTPRVNLSTGTGAKAVVEAPAEKAPAEKVTQAGSKAPVSEVTTEKEPTGTATGTGTATDKADPVVRTSPKVTPGKAGTTKANTDLKQAADTVGKQLNSAAKKISDGFKNGFAKPSKKAADSGAGAHSSGSASGTGSSGGSE